MVKIDLLQCENEHFNMYFLEKILRIEQDVHYVSTADLLHNSFEINDSKFDLI